MSLEAVGRARKITILLIDDNPAEHKLVGVALSIGKLDAELLSAWDGEEGFQKLIENPAIDVVMVDLNMPKMNGMEFMKAVKSYLTLEHTPIVVYSTTEAPYEIQRVYELGATAFFTKPLATELPDLLQTLVAAVQNNDFEMIRQGWKPATESNTQSI